MSESILVWPIAIPLAAGVLTLGCRGKLSALAAPVAFLASVATLALSIMLWGKSITATIPQWGVFENASLRLYPFSQFIVLAVASFAVLVSLYSWPFMKDKARGNQFYSYMMLSVGMVIGAVLADHLVLMLFFWEGLLLPLFGIIAIGRPGAWKTATKALIIVGISDLCMMFGIVLAGWTAGTMSMSHINLPLNAMGATAMILMMIGAISKAGSMPFHSWIPDAALDAPLPFMAILPASLEKLAGIYLLARISLDMFQFNPHSWMSPVMMTIGSVTIIFAVMMALVQKDYKRLLSYHAISQVGYMVLGIGTALPIGIVGGLFHMINNAIYKSCLFLSGGAVERQAGTTDLNKLGGLARKMPVTFGCFLVAAVAISGVPPFNGFFSKELIYDAALEHGVIFYIAAILGSFFTAASFLKLGHAAYCGRRDAGLDNVREAPLSMLAPMLVLAALCIVFGLGTWFDLGIASPIANLIQPALDGSRYATVHAEEIAKAAPHFAGWPTSSLLVALTAVSLVGALLNHLAGAKRYGGGLHAADHIQNASFLGGIYRLAMARAFDPYDAARYVVKPLARGLWAIDRAIDWVYDVGAVWAAGILSRGIRLAHNGNFALYVIWAMVGSAAVLVYLLV